MFVLTRGVRQKVQIGNGTVEIVEIRGSKVRFGFCFPQEVEIFRSEMPAYKRRTLADQQRGRVKKSENSMLVLTREKGESFKIGSDITLTLERINQTSVRISIDAPPEVPIVRSELQPHRATE